MKKIKLYLTLSLFLFSYLISSAQVIESESGEHISKEEWVKLNPPSSGTGELADLDFGFTIFSAQNNHDKIQQAEADDLDLWFLRQNLIIVSEIASRFGKNYPTFDAARDDYFRFWERDNLLRNAGGVKNMYDSRINSRTSTKERHLRNIKLLELREQELNLGNVDNTSYGSFNFNGVPIGDITNIRQLNSLRNQEISSFSTNEWQLHNDRGASQYIGNTIIQDMGSYANRFNFNYAILNDLLPNQVSHYNNIHNHPDLLWHYSWYRLDLMQLYLNNIVVSIPNIPPPVHTTSFGNANYLEDYAYTNRTNGYSIFDDQYVRVIVEDLSAGMSNYEFERAEEYLYEQAEIQAENEREDYLNELLDDIGIDFEDQIISNLTGTVKCTYQKMQNLRLFRNTIKEFNGVDAPVHLIINQGNIADPDTSGETDYALGEPYIKILLDTDHMTNRPSLFAVSVILHEAIHAEIYRKIKTRGGLIYDSLNRVWTINGERANFPTLFDYYNEDPRTAHHNFMADYYRNALEKGLKDYAALIGETYSDQLIRDLAWGGLQGTKAWNNMFADPVHTENEQNRILKSILDFTKTGKNDCK